MKVAEWVNSCLTKVRGMGEMVKNESPQKELVKGQTLVNACVAGRERGAGEPHLKAKRNKLRVLHKHARLRSAELTSGMSLGFHKVVKSYKTYIQSQMDK